MQGYGDTEWTKFKMIEIKEFMRDFDPMYVSWEEFEQNQMDMLPDVSEDTYIFLKPWKKHKEYAMVPNIETILWYSEL